MARTPLESKAMGGRAMAASESSHSPPTVSSAKMMRSLWEGVRTHTPSPMIGSKGRRVKGSDRCSQPPDACDLDGFAKFVLLEGAQIDYVDDLMKAGFTIFTPTAVKSCACGTSFQTAEGSGQASPCSH